MAFFTQAVHDFVARHRAGTWLSQRWRPGHFLTWPFARSECLAYEQPGMRRRLPGQQRRHRAHAGCHGGTRAPQVGADPAQADAGAGQGCTVHSHGPRLAIDLDMSIGDKHLRLP